MAACWFKASSAMKVQFVQEEDADRWRCQILCLGEDAVGVTGLVVLLLAYELVFFLCWLPPHGSLLSLTGGSVRCEHFHLLFLCGSKGNQWSSTTVAYYWPNSDQADESSWQLKSKFVVCIFHYEDVIKATALFRKASPWWKSCPYLSLSFILYKIGSLDLRMAPLSGNQ